MNKYWKVELTSIAFVTFGLYVFSSFEYKFYEQKSMPSFYGDIDLTLIWGFFSFSFAGAYYYLFLKPQVLNNRHWLVFISIPLAILISNYFDKYVRDFVLMHLEFLPETIVKYHKKSFLNFNKSMTTISYKLSHMFLSLVGIAYLVRALQQNETIKTLKEEQLITELKYLKDRLNPHFFFNTLNNIYALAVENSNKTPGMVAGLSAFMRYMLYESDKEQVSLKREVEMMRRYVELEKIRYGTNFDITFDSQGIGEKDSIPPLLFLPFIENAFKHGLEDEIENGFVKVAFVKVENQLIFQVENSIPKAKPRLKVGGIGLETAEKRLKLIFAEKCVIDIVEDEIFRVQVSVNFEP